MTAFARIVETNTVYSSPEQFRPLQCMLVCTQQMFRLGTPVSGGLMCVLSGSLCLFSYTKYSMLYYYIFNQYVLCPWVGRCCPTAGYPIHCKCRRPSGS